MTIINPFIFGYFTQMKTFDRSASSLIALSQKREQDFINPTFDGQPGIFAFLAAGKKSCLCHIACYLFICELNSDHKLQFLNYSREVSRC
jgi:hypothetical protein